MNSLNQNSEFCVIFFNLYIFFAPSIYKEAVASNISSYHFILPRLSPVVKIIYTHDGVKYVKAPLCGILWDVASDGSRRVHLDGVITNIPNYSPLNVRTTLQTTKGDLLITFSTSSSGSGCLVVVYGGWLSRRVIQMQSTTPGGTCTSYYNYFRQGRSSNDLQ